MVKVRSYTDFLQMLHPASGFLVTRSTALKISQEGQSGDEVALIILGGGRQGAQVGGSRELRLAAVRELRLVPVRELRLVAVRELRLAAVRELRLMAGRGLRLEGAMGLAVLAWLPGWPGARGVGQPRGPGGLKF